MNDSDQQKDASNGVVPSAMVRRQFSDIHEIVYPNETPTMSAEMDEWKVRKERTARGEICGKCRHASPTFKLNGINHVQCQHPNATAASTTAWDTLREMDDVCAAFSPNAKAEPRGE